MDYYVKSVIPVIESNYENFTALEKNIADFFMKNEEKDTLLLAHTVLVLYASGSGVWHRQ